jgi:fumarate reductase subunit D
MNDLNKALGDISSIRRQVAHSTEFRGYGPATLASTGVLAIATAGAQALRLPDSANHISAYLSIWIGTAVLSAGLIGMQMYARTRRIHSGMADEMIRMAVEQFLPSVGAGALITLVLVLYVPVALWMLPGIWQIIFGLGVFSSCRFLPRPVAAAGAWYLLTGLTCIALADSRALSPWAMGIPYGAGQLLVAGILLFAAREGGDENEGSAGRSAVRV